ncbi:secretogranin-2b [Stigmatopora nigra]
MLHFPRKSPTGAAVVLLAVLLHGAAVQAASLPRHYRLRGDGGEGQPVGSDLLKALEYIENLKQRNGGRVGPPAANYDEVDKFRVLLQLASQQQQQDEAPAERHDITAEQLMRSLLKSIQDQAKFSPSTTPRNDRRPYRHRTKDTETEQSSPTDYSNYPRAHKKYPLMFEDEENADASKRTTEDLDQKYTPQSLANLRSIFEELERMPMSLGQKRDIFGEDAEDGDEEQDPREEWVPVEEREETEEMVNGSHEEAERALGDEEDEDGEEVQRRANQDQEDADDDTKLVDYYLLKVLEMSDQTQNRDQTGEQRKRLIRPSIVDPGTLKELLELSLKLHVPPQDLIDMLLTEELRKLHRNPPPSSSRYTTGQTPKVRYYSRRLPLKTKTASAPEDMDREDFLDIIGVETISNEYPVIPRPAKSSLDRISNPEPKTESVKIPPPAGRRENLFLSELNKMPLRRQADDDDSEDGDVEDEVTTYLAAKILTEYPPNGIAKRDTQAQTKGRFPYELYERAVKDYLSQVDSGNNRPMAKREAEEEKPTEVQSEEEEEEEEGMKAKTSAPVPGTTSEGDGGEGFRDKAVAGM